MKSLYARSLIALLGVLGLADYAAAQGFGSGSLLPTPDEQVRPVGYTKFASRNKRDAEMPAPMEFAPTDQPAGDVGPVESHGYSPTPAPVYSQGTTTGSCAGGSSYSTAGGYVPCEDEGYGSYGVGYGGPRWFVSSGALILTRSQQGRVPFTYNDTGFKTLMTDDSVTQKTAGGFQITGGRILGCGNAAIGVTYWNLQPGNTMYSVNPGAGGVRTPIPFGQLSYNPGAGVRSVDTYYNSAPAPAGPIQFHQLRSRSTFDNVEVNYYGNPGAWGFLGGFGGPGFGGYNGGHAGGCGDCCDCCCCGIGSRFSYGWLAGFRYFNFTESLLFSSSNLGATYDLTNVNQLNYRLDYDNNLSGFQMGGIGNFAINNCWSIYGMGRAGVFNNHVKGWHQVFGGNGDAMITAGDYAGTAVNYRSSRNGLAVMGELDLGVRYQATCRLGLYAGYRVFGIAGVATPSANVARTFNDPRDQRYINTNDSLLLHGVSLGGTFCF